MQYNTLQRYVVIVHARTPTSLVIPTIRPRDPPRLSTTNRNIIISTTNSFFLGFDLPFLASAPLSLFPTVVRSQHLKTQQRTQELLYSIDLFFTRLSYSPYNQKSYYQKTNKTTTTTSSHTNPHNSPPPPTCLSTSRPPPASTPRAARTLTLLLPARGPSPSATALPLRPRSVAVLHRLPLPPTRLLPRASLPPASQ